MRNFEFETLITEGKIQKIENIKFDFNSITIIFQSMFDGKRKQLTIYEMFFLSVQPDDNELEDVMEYETLIGYDYEMTGMVFVHCLRTDNYEIVFKSYRPPELIDLL